MGLIDRLKEMFSGGNAEPDDAPMSTPPPAPEPPAQPPPPPTPESQPPPDTGRPL